MDNISKIGANANFYIQSQSLKKEGGEYRPFRI